MTVKTDAAAFDAPQTRLRSPGLASPFRIVLVEPEIPQNTGSIARTCAATGSPLHLVGPLGFRIDDHAVRRAGLDYWHLVTVTQHDGFDAFRAAHPDARPAIFAADAETSYLDADLRPGDALVFGRESVGLPQALVDAHRPRVFGIPMPGKVRSLNLSNAVAIVLFEALRRSGGLSPATRA